MHRIYTERTVYDDMRSLHILHILQLLHILHILHILRSLHTLHILQRVDENLQSGAIPAMQGYVWSRSTLQLFTHKLALALVVYLKHFVTFFSFLFFAKLRGLL